MSGGEFGCDWVEEEAGVCSSSFTWSVWVSTFYFDLVGLELGFHEF